MPLKRTPPASPAPQTPTAASRSELPTLLAVTSASPLQHCESEPNLREIAANFTERKKRKYEDEHLDVTVLIKEMFSTFSKQQDKRFQELKTSLELMSSKYDEFLQKISTLEKERKEDKISIKELEEKLEASERKSRGAGIEIRNIPKQSGETKESLCNEFMQLGKTLSVNIDCTNIRDIYRLKSKDASNPVVVDFTSVLIKDRILKALKSFNKARAKGEKLNTTHLNHSYQFKPVYITETLTHKTQRLFFLARQFKKSYGYDFCWTTNGYVYLKKTEDSSHIRINHDPDLDKLRNLI